MKKAMYVCVIWDMYGPMIFSPSGTKRLESERERKKSLRCVTCAYKQSAALAIIGYTREKKRKRRREYQIPWWLLIRCFILREEREDNDRWEVIAIAIVYMNINAKDLFWLYWCSCQVIQNICDSRRLSVINQCQQLLLLLLSNKKEFDSSLTWFIPRD